MKVKELISILKRYEDMDIFFAREVGKDVYRMTDSAQVICAKSLRNLDGSEGEDYIILKMFDDGEIICGN